MHHPFQDRSPRRSPRLATSVVALVAVVFLVTATHSGSNALLAAAKSNGHGGSTSSSISLVMVNDLNGNGLPNYGDTITFNVSTSATWPSVEVDCIQSGALVYQGITGFYPTYMWSNNYTLSSYFWTGGAADCTATLYTTAKNGRNTTLATTSFSVGA